MKLIHFCLSFFIFMNTTVVYAEPRAQAASAKKPEVSSEKATVKPKLSCSDQITQIHKICSPDTDNQKISTGSSEKLIDSYSTKSQTQKMSIIKKALNTNIINNQLVRCETSIIDFKKVCPNDKTVTAEELRLIDYKKNNDKLLLQYKNSYCASVLMPDENKVRTEEDTTNDPNKCKNKDSLEFVQKVFDMCTKGVEGYDEAKCKCHIQDLGNSCIPQKTAMEKLETSLKGTSLVDDPNCDTKETPAKSSFDTGKFFTTALAILAIGGLFYLARKQIKKMDSKNNGTATDAAGNIVQTSPGTGGGNQNSNSKVQAAKISGTVNPPSMDERIAMRDRNRANGDGDGGGSDGGIYMQGAFELSIDANGVVTSSNVIIHGTSGFTAVGQIKTDGSTFSLNLKESGIHDVGTLVLSIKGSAVSGKMHHGGGKEWIYGDAVGNYSPK